MPDGFARILAPNAGQRNHEYPSIFNTFDNAADSARMPQGLPEGIKSLAYGVDNAANSVKMPQRSPRD
jgi:hypothetical protein